MVEQAEKTALRYAGEVIEGTPERFDCIEIQGVSAVAEEDGQTFYEVDNDNPDLYSVYLHLVLGGVVCVGDFTLLDDAEAYAEELQEEYGWGIQCFAPKR